MAESKGGDAASASWTVDDWRNFHPLYTLQPVETTRHHQLKVWVDMVHAWAAERKQWTISLADCPVFENSSISRKLSQHGIEAVASALVSDGRAERDGPGRLRLYPQRPSHLATAFYEWVARNSMLNTVYTVFELHDESVAAPDNPCRGVDMALFRKVLDILENESKADVFQGTTTDEDGVKFYAAS